jgi:hypothetical protein
MTATIGELSVKHDFSILDHLDQQVEVPVLGGLQFQGDLAVIPLERKMTGAWRPVPPEGVPVIEAVGSGHEHRLFASEAGTASLLAGAGGQDIGYLEVTETAYLAHPEHAFAGIAPGSYVLRRQREQADEERLVAD